MIIVLLDAKRRRKPSTDKLAQASREYIEILLGTILGHPPRQDATGRDQGSSMRTDENGLARSRRSRWQGRFKGGDFGIDFIDYRG